MPSESHIVPVLIGDPKRCKAVSDELLLRFGTYVQPINYPTVPRGTERLRLTPTPLHSDEQIEQLVTALTEIWNRKTARKRSAYGTRSPASDRGDRG
jgi:5-aminolevulinate synthase